MPGIAGIFGRGNEDRHAAELRQMVDAMLHEPSYSTGTYVNTSAGIYIGWVAHSGSFADGMPVWNEARDVCLFFAGEDFSDESAGERSGTKTDAHEVDATYLIRRYEAA